jgi:hypothetical protein
MGAEPSMFDMGHLALLLGLIAVSLLLLILAFRQERRWRLIRDLPTSHPGGISVGLVEVVGKIQCSQVLTSHLSESACTWYRWSVEEHWSRMVTETSTDAQGHSHTTTREESGWRSVASGGDEQPFFLEDDTGKVLVKPGGAKVVATASMDEVCNRSDPLYYAKGPASAVSDSDHRRRFHETLLPLSASCYVIGQAHQNSDFSAVEIERDPHAPIFVISLAGQKSVASGYFWSGLSSKIAGLAVALFGTFVLVGGHEGDYVLWCTISLMVYAGCCMLGWFWLVFNSLVELRQRVHQGWSNVDVQLKRRFDLISQLIPLIMAITGHESVTQQAVAAMRCQQQATPPGVAGPNFAAVSPQLGAVVQSYPDLIAQGQFQRLHQALVECEDHIALSRNYFNDISTSWNTRLERFPDLLVAKITGMTAQSLMQHFQGSQDPAPVIKM